MNIRIAAFISFILLLGINSNAQQMIRANSSFFNKSSAAIINSNKSVSASSKLVASFFIDYDSADATIHGPANYNRLIWSVNNNYTPADSGIRSCIIAFDSLFDVYSNNTYHPDSINSLALDSFFIWIGHENNSGTSDTLVMSIIALDSAYHYPNPSVVYDDVWVIIPPGSPLTGSWTSIQKFKFIPWSSIPAKRFGIKIDYYGSKLDTLGIVAGFGNKGSCGSSPYLADTTHFSKVNMKNSGGKFIANSYIHYSAFPTLPYLPTPNGSNLYFDCNNNNQYEPGLDSESPLQNILLVAHLKSNAVGVNEIENSISDLSLYPNPSNGEVITIKFSVNNYDPVTLDVYDYTGKVIFNTTINNYNANIVSYSLNHCFTSGCYMLRINNRNSSIAKILTIVR